MKVLITGGSGFIGRALARALLARGDSVWVLSRQPRQVQRRLPAQVQIIGDLAQWVEPMDAVVNLAGAPIAAARWSDGRKQQLWQSRIDYTQALVTHMLSHSYLPRVFVNGSAIGVYGTDEQRCFSESASVTAGENDFAARLCLAWEQAVTPLTEHGVRTCILRIGLVLHPSGGMLRQMLMPFKLGLGGRLGAGRQWMSWIHRDDAVGGIVHCLDQLSLRGPVNLVAPNPVSNAEFTQTLARTLRRPAWCHVPAWLLQQLLGELSQLMLSGQCIQPERLQRSGYQFRYSDLNAALKACLTRG